MAGDNHELTRTLYALIDGETKLSRLRLLYRLTDELYDRADRISLASFFELRLWCGLKIDTPAMAEEYRENVRAALPWVDEKAG